MIERTKNVEMKLAELEKVTAQYVTISLLQSSRWYSASGNRSYSGVALGSLTIPLPPEMLS